MARNLAIKLIVKGPIHLSSLIVKDFSFLLPSVGFLQQCFCLFFGWHGFAFMKAPTLTSLLPNKGRRPCPFLRWWKSTQDGIQNLDPQKTYPRAIKFLSHILHSHKFLSNLITLIKVIVRKTVIFDKNNVISIEFVLTWPLLFRIYSKMDYREKIYLSFSNTYQWLVHWKK